MAPGEAFAVARQLPLLHAGCRASRGESWREFPRASWDAVELGRIDANWCCQIVPLWLAWL